MAPYLFNIVFYIETILLLYFNCKRTHQNIQKLCIFVSFDICLPCNLYGNNKSILRVHILVLLCQGLQISLNLSHILIALLFLSFLSFSIPRMPMSFIKHIISNSSAINPTFSFFNFIFNLHNIKTCISCCKQKMCILHSHVSLSFHFLYAQRPHIHIFHISTRSLFVRISFSVISWSSLVNFDRQLLEFRIYISKILFFCFCALKYIFYQSHSTVIAFPKSELSRNFIVIKFLLIKSKQIYKLRILEFFLVCIRILMELKSDQQFFRNNTSLKNEWCHHAFDVLKQFQKQTMFWNTNKHIYQHKLRNHQNVFYLQTSRCNFYELQKSFF